MKHKRNLMELQMMMSHPEDFIRLREINYLDTEHLLSMLEVTV